MMTDMMTAPWWSLVNEDGSSPDLNVMPTIVKDANQWYRDEIRPVVVRFIYVPLWQAAWSHQEEKQHLRVAQQILEAARRVAASNSFAVASVQLTNTSLSLKTQTAYDRLRFVFPGSFFQSYDRFALRAVQAETFRSLTVTAIALKRYELRHGKLAPALTDLVPEFLPSVPLDFMNGQPLRYRLNADGTFRLYSVGEDGRDDEGDPRPAEAGGSFRTIFAGRDWVWPVPATPEEIEDAEPKPKRK